MCINAPELAHIHLGGSELMSKYLYRGSEPSGTMFRVTKHGRRKMILSMGAGQLDLCHTL